MFSVRVTPLVLLFSFIVFQHADAWSRRRRRRRYCPIQDCEVSYWSSWSSCSANLCGQRGHQSRSRTITAYSSCGGAACPSSLDETRQCYSSAPVNCQLSSWSEWSACTATSCTQFSSRHRITTEQCGGTCTSTFRKTRTCSPTSVDCQNGGSLKGGRCCEKADSLSQGLAGGEIAGIVIVVIIASLGLSVSLAIWCICPEIGRRCCNQCCNCCYCCNRNQVNNFRS